MCVLKPGKCLILAVCRNPLSMACSLPSKPTGTAPYYGVSDKRMKFYCININRYFRYLMVFSFALITSVSYAGSPSLPDPLKAGWKGKQVCERLHEDAKKRILRCTFPPGTGHERHYHVAHFGYAISGGRVQMTNESGIKTLDLTTGSSYTSAGTLWHEVENTGDTTIIYLIVEDKISQHKTSPDD